MQRVRKSGFDDKKELCCWEGGGEAFLFFSVFDLLQTTRVFYFYWECVLSLYSEMIPRASVLHASSVKTKRDLKQL